MYSPLSDKQVKSLGLLLHTALKDIRILCWENKSQQSAELADAICQLPLRMFSDDFRWEHYKDALSAYQQQYHCPGCFDYVQFLKCIEADV
jgi:hypothetical protein